MNTTRTPAGSCPLVDPVGRPVLRTIVGIYRALLDEIARRDYNVLDGRISLARLAQDRHRTGGVAGRMDDG